LGYFGRGLISIQAKIHQSDFCWLGSFTSDVLEEMSIKLQQNPELIRRLLEV